MTLKPGVPNAGRSLGAGTGSVCGGRWVMVAVAGACVAGACGGVVAQAARKLVTSTVRSRRIRSSSLLLLLRPLADLPGDYCCHVQEPAAAAGVPAAGTGAGIGVSCAALMAWLSCKT